MNDVWRILPLPQGTYRYVFAKAGGMVDGTWVSGPEALGAFAQRYAKANCYITLNPVSRADRTRPSSNDVSHVQAILVDIDPIEPSAQPGEALWEARDMLESMEVDPWSMTVVDSGRGIQCWIRFKPLTVDKQLARTVKNFVNTLSAEFGTRYGCVIDSSCSDLARLARLPGTMNQKTGREARLVVEGDVQSAAFLFHHQEDGPIVWEVPIPGLRTTWPQAAMFLTLTGREFIQFGVEQTRRHKCCYAASKSLLEAGVPEAIATEWLLKGAERCDPPLESGEVLRIVKRVYAKA
jgi:hypothetical protein